MTEPDERPIQQLGQRLWLGAKFGVLLALLMLVSLTGYELITAPTGIYHDDSGVRWDRILAFVASWALPLLGLNVVLGALHYCRAPHE